MSDRADRTANAAGEPAAAGEPSRTAGEFGERPPVAANSRSDDRSVAAAPQEVTAPKEVAALQEVNVDGLPKIISFASLARCGDEVWIETGGQVYRLRKTRQGKLILTK